MSKLALSAALCGLCLLTSPSLAQQAPPQRVAVPPVQDSGDFKLTRELVYVERAGSPLRHTTLNVYQPKETGEPAPVVVFVHGGAWRYGNKEQVKDKPRWAVSNGWVFVSVDHRPAPDVQHPEHARDIAASVAWVMANIADYGGDPARVAVVGHSSGAHLAGLVAADESLLEEVGHAPADLAGLVLLDGAAYDIPQLMESVAKMRRAREMYELPFGTDTAVWAEASPALQANLGDTLPPLLAVHAGNRKLSREQTSQLAAAWAAAGAEVSVHHAANKDHASINTELGNDDADTAVVTAFLQERFDQAADEAAEAESSREDTSATDG